VFSFDLRKTDLSILFFPGVRVFWDHWFRPFHMISVENRSGVG
jgi:hypothetical protein